MDDQFFPTQFKEITSKFRNYINTQKYMIRYKCIRDGLDFICKENWVEVNRIINLVDELDDYFSRWKNNRKNLEDMIIYQRANSKKYDLDEEESIKLVENIKIIDNDTITDEIIEAIAETEERILKNIINKHMGKLNILDEDSNVIDIIIDNWLLQHKFIERDEVKQFIGEEYPNI